MEEMPGKMARDSEKVTGFLPLPGTFIRPVGRFIFGYCYRVTEDITNWETPFPRVECERWGMTDKRPVDDGHIMAGHTVYLVPFLPRIWIHPYVGYHAHDKRRRRFPERSEIYYVAMTLNQRGQGSLF